MVLYSKERHNFNQHGRWNKSVYIAKDGVKLRLENCCGFCVDMATLMFNIYCLPFVINTSSILLFEFGVIVFKIKSELTRWNNKLAWCIELALIFLTCVFRLNLSWKCKVKTEENNVLSVCIFVLQKHATYNHVTPHRGPKSLSFTISGESTPIFLQSNSWSQKHGGFLMNLTSFYTISMATADASNR